jgi:hypothetical protein
MTTEDTPKAPAKRGRPRKAAPALESKNVPLSAQGQAEGQPENPIDPATGAYLSR